ncbi:MAG TPA: mycofactocin biosynthesis chaperone MftB [Ilumatobacteraceae bacterium]|nr:mycofactocin biosynthesis chaperone MftB [Ilumatobacteraceae bacterium]HRA83884.1 mycofactocin biosynthesis chaperone MftB [Ilumatobacteraceae bacterium]HRC48910.1 mycofactocin biosynthesis chaperone MftB [Ilumatobacteraceae bacterium]
MSTELISHPLLATALELHPQVALRPEPFGALAYHYGNRRLVFLKHPDMVAVANSLAGHATFAEALQACGIDPQRWPSFVTAFASLQESHVVRERAVHEESPE